MPTIGKILGQVKPAANTNATLYTAPSNVAYTMLNLYIANTNTTADDSYSIALVKAGSNPSNQNYISYSIPLETGTAVDYTNIVLDPGSYIQVNSTGGNVAFTATGMEVS